MDTTVKTRYKNDKTKFYEVCSYELGTPVIVSGIVDNSADVSRNSFVTAEYPDWNYRELIRNADNATTQLFGELSGFSALPHLFGGKEIYERPTFMRPSSPITADLRIHHPSDPLHNTGKYHLESHMAAFWYIDTPASDLTSLHNSIDLQAKQRYLNNVIKTQKKFDSLVFGGELKETISLILSPGRALRKSLNEHTAGFLKKGAPRKFPSFRKMRQYVQGKWLEYVFGVQPLISDVRDGAEALASHIVDRVPNRKVTSSAKGQFQQLFDGSIHNRSVSGTPFRFEYKNANLLNAAYCRYFGCVYNPNWENGLDASSLGLDWRNVAPAIYELIPYSFLVDYFTNLGGLINYYSYGTANVKWTNRTFISHSECYWTTPPVCTAPNIGTNVIDSFTTTPGSYTPYFIRRSVSRSPYFGHFYPGIQFKIPNELQWLNIAALIDSSDKVFKGILKGVRL